MKKMLKIVGLWCFLLSGTGMHAGNVTGVLNPSAITLINRLNRVEAAPGTYTSQIEFRFVRPLYYEKEEVVPGEEVRLYFPGMRLEDFDRHAVVGKMQSIPGVKGVSVGFETLPIPRVVLTMRFAKDSVLLLLTKMEEPNLLVLDVFDKQILESVGNQVTTLRTASNTKAPMQVKQKLLALLKDVKKNTNYSHIGPILS